TESARRETARAEAPAPVPREVTDWVDRAIVPESKPLFARPAILVGAATIYTSSGMGPAFAPIARASIGAPIGFAGRLSFIGPAFGGEVRSPRGTAFIRQELALAEVVYAPSVRWLSPIASLGVGGYHLYMRGDSTDPTYAGVTNQAWAFVADVGVGA